MITGRVWNWETPSVTAFQAEPELVILLLARSLGNHSFAATMLNSELLAPLQDHSRHYYIYPLRVCHSCNRFELGATIYLSTPVCALCASNVEVPANSFRLSDSLNFQCAKLTPTYHNLLLEYLL